MDQCNFKPVYNKDNRKRPQVGVQCRSSTHLFSYRYLLPRDREKAGALSLLLGELLDQQVISQVPHAEHSQGVYSHVFVVRKPSGKFRLILNLRPLNKFIRYKHFRMESIFMVTNLLFPDCYMQTIDLRDTYLHVPIHRDFQKFLRLAIRVNLEVLHFQFRALPFGLASFPRIFTKVLAEALAPLRVRAITVIPYLDKLLFVTQSYQQLEENLQEAQLFLRSLGWLINRDKSQLIPTQEVQYLGYRISSIERKVFLPSEKIEKVGLAVVQLQTNQDAHVRDVMRVMGLMTSCFGQGFISIRYRLSFCSAGMAASRVGINLCLYPQKSKGHYGGGEPITS